MQKTESIKFKICYFLSQVTSELSTSSGNFGSLSERTDDFEKQIHLEKEQVQKKEAELKVSYNVASFTLNLLYLAKEIRTLYKGGNIECVFYCNETSFTKNLNHSTLA